MSALRVAVATVATVLLSAETAEAGHHAHACQEVSNVVGDRRCGRFGDLWATERTIPGFIAIGGFTGAVQPSGTPFNGTVSKNGATAYTFDGSSLVEGPLRSYGVDVRVGGYVSRRAYIGWEWALGLGHARTQTYEVNGYTLSASSGINFLQARTGALLGARAPLGRASLRLEALVGVQVLWLGHQARSPDGSVKSGSGGNVALLVEPRIAADWWVAPDTTLSVWGGANPFRPGDYTAGISFAAHGRAFDGMFR